MTLREDLADWCDWDDAVRAYGLALGVFDGATERQVRRVLMTDNPLGDGLTAGLTALIEAGVLEHREDPEEQFRWRLAGPQDLPGAAESGDVDELPVALDLPQLGDTEAAATDGSRRWWQRG